MATIKDYLKYYKNISFKENKLNINDVIIFSELSYIDWSNIVPKGNNKITLKEAFTTYQEFKKDIYLTSFMKENISNLKDIYNSNRYKDIYLSNYRRLIDNEKQFGAITIHFADKVFISFMGTNGTVIGWKEDLSLAYSFPVVAQKTAIKYLDEVITSNDNEIFVGGHSKGGNLAMTSVMYIKEDIFNRIKTIYNLDGPGFRDKEYTSSNFKKILPKLQVYVPEDTIVGMLLNTSNNKYIVKSTSRGVLSHNMNTWQCFGEFLEKGKQSKLSITIDNRIKSWFKNYNDKEIERMINAIFNILENNNIKEFKEIKNLKWSQIVKLISEVHRFFPIILVLHVPDRQQRQLPRLPPRYPPRPEILTPRYRDEFPRWQLTDGGKRT